MKDELIKPFQRSCKEILLQVGKVEFVEQRPYEKNSVDIDGMIAIIIGISGGVKGQVLITISEEMTKRIVSNIHSGIPIAVIDNMAKKTILELCTMMVANAVVGLFNVGIATEITLAGVLEGKELSYYIENAQIISIPFKRDNEVIELLLIVKYMDK